MQNAYQTELWRDVFVVLSSSSAALIGLFFIATSLHIEEIVNNVVLRRRTFNNMRYLLIVFVDALLMLIPQPVILVGGELAVLNIFGLWLSLMVVYVFVKRRTEYGQGGGTIQRSFAFVVGFLLGVAGGASFIGRLEWAVYLIASSCIILLTTIVLNAWSIMVGVGRSEKISAS